MSKIIIIATLYLVASIATASEEKKEDHIPEIESCEKFVEKYMKKTFIVSPTWEDPEGVFKKSKKHNMKECQTAHGKTNDEFSNVSLARATMGDHYKFLGERVASQLWYISAYKYAKKFPYEESAKKYKDLNRFNIGWSAYKLGMEEKGSSSKDMSFGYFLEAAQHGNNKAQYEVGLAYKNGRGTIRNYIEAYAWFNIYSSNSYSDKIKEAKEEMDELESIMTLSGIEKAQELSKQYKSKIWQ